MKLASSARPSLGVTLRFILPLALVFAIFAYAVVPLVDHLTLRWFMNDLDTRSEVIANTLQEPLSEYLSANQTIRVRQLFERALRDRRLYALGFCDNRNVLTVRTADYPQSLRCSAPDTPNGSSLLNLPEGKLHVSAKPVDGGGQRLGTLFIVHDVRYIESRIADAKKYLVGVVALLAFVISVIVGLLAHWSWRGWIASVKSLLQGRATPQPYLESAPEIQPLVGDLRDLLREIEDERRVLDHVTQMWTPDTLRRLLREQLTGDEVLVVSNREPYIHVTTPRGVEVRRPASGLVSAVEPVMRACSGTWIAHASGSADREVCDDRGRVAVPPDNPSYTLRRVWLSKEEEAGYYYGFANEGLWPLCHIAHVRPVFRASNWAHYSAVNKRFADAVAEEARTDNPVILVQDYHFALLPRLIRRALPRATIITFWHIPWPNAESFGICPWRKEILDGLLGSTILGFHTRFHCANFLETVDRYLETRIERETSTISYGGKLTQVKHYPISIEWPEATRAADDQDVAATVRLELGLPADHFLGIGVDRMDYTKGILERLEAVERMLELQPEMAGRFTFLQVAAPTRSTLAEYEHFEARVRALALRINQRFCSAPYPPIILKVEYHGPEKVNRLYRAANVCMVTSLHDGMNLVAKEFVAARDDERGVLILSQFTGACYELHEALIVNPYHIEQMAQALYRAITMPSVEQSERMRSMRALVRHFNIFRWAGRMLLDAARMRHRERVAARIQSHSRTPLRRVI
jgi:trehalose 6-phosphate synthase